MLRVAIVGCGKIADAHASQIQRVPGCEIVGVCDHEKLMAQQLQERFPIQQHFDDCEQLLQETRPDVVHITTPPPSHFEIAKLCLERGCHIYVEKPFTLHTREAEEIIALGERKGLKVTVGHDDQFSPVSRRMRELVRNGFLGGPPIHLESYYGYELTDGYAQALLGDKQHWVRRLPGGLLQNIISHGIARIAEFMSTQTTQVAAHGFVSPSLQSRGETEIVDELRVMVSEPTGLTAYFTFSTQARPASNQFRVYGTRNTLFLDADQQILLKFRGDRYKSYLEKFVPEVTMAKQHLGCLATNVRLFLANDFHMKSGMKYLIESFYRSIRDGSPVPIPYREILLVSRIMDAIFEQLSARSRSLPDQFEDDRRDSPPR